MSISEVYDIIHDCKKCDGKRTQMVNHGDGGGWGITQCSCVNELDEYLWSLTQEQRDSISKELKN